MALSDDQIWLIAGKELRDPVRATIATAIALAESGGIAERVSPPNSNGTVDYGLWQINSVHQKAHPTWTNAWLLNPQNNAKAMGSISSGGDNWKPWKAYTNGKYKNFLPRAQAALEKQREHPGIIDQITEDVPGVSTIADLGTTVGNVVSAVAGWITNSQNWIRVVQVVGGVGLGLIAVAIIAQSTVKKVQ